MRSALKESCRAKSHLHLSSQCFGSAVLRRGLLRIFVRLGAWYHFLELDSNSRPWECRLWIGVCHVKMTQTRTSVLVRFGCALSNYTIIELQDQGQLIMNIYLLDIFQPQSSRITRTCVSSLSVFENLLSLPCHSLTPYRSG